jgi:NADPH-dependent 2,4-dienoyl-CoA reductase/sulfur reductase-like enzyme
VGQECRLSGHWTGAAEQAQLVAATMLGAGDAHRPVDEGYFWSDQYDVRLQFTGSVPAEAQITVTSGRVEDRRFVALCGDAERVTGVFAMGSPREFLRRTLELRAAQATEVGA